jgi:hypothetical protein
MPFSHSLTTLAHYLAGEFDNQDQATADPVWFVPLRMWQRPVALFEIDSYALFIEQANLSTLGSPYRQRILRLLEDPDRPSLLKAQYYAFKDPLAVRGAGQNPELLRSLRPDQLEYLPGCVLWISQTSTAVEGDRFVATSPADARCCFTYDGKIRQVSLGFEATATIFLSYDKGIDPDTGKALWGAMMGAYAYTKRQNFACQ